MDYPRPQFQRDSWQSLNGSWDYSFNQTQDSSDLSWDGKITVPYPPEAKLSGVHDESYHSVIWYQRSFSVPKDWQGKRVLLHFGAVDYRARVWVNGQLVVTHEGGHTPFHADITGVLVDGEQTVTVRAEDDPHDLSQPRGKQEWQEKPHGIWYPRTTGIWQTVWLEPVSDTHLKSIRMTPQFSDHGNSISCRFDINRYPATGEDLTLEVTFTSGELTLANDTFKLSLPKLERNIGLAMNGFEEWRQFMWSPEHPNLIDVKLTLKQGDEVLDEVSSYTALRVVEAREGKFFLNRRPYYLRLALDQGYWEESLLAAPDSEALKKDVELAKAMGFNGVRKHQKIEDPRFLYWADKLGLLVWEEMPSAYHFTPESIGRLTREWLEVIERDYNHPCIVTWVCFNESWGVSDLAHSGMQRDLVAGLYHLTKSLDSSRPVVGNDGWEHVLSDLLTLHDYQRDADVLAERYGSEEASEDTSFNVLLHHGRVNILDSSPIAEEPVILSEFGGIRYNPEPGEAGWGYQEADSPEKLLEVYAAMIKAISGGLAGFCYTQLTDTFQEQNGLLYMDRSPKVLLEDLAKATREGR